MSWGAVISGVAGVAGSAIANSGGGSGGGPVETAHTEHIGSLLNDNLQSLIAARTGAITDGTQLRINALQNSLAPQSAGIGRAGGLLSNGFGTARNEIQQGNANAQAFLNPLIERGDAANTALNGIVSDANNPNFFDVDSNDPGLRFIQEQGARAVDAGANATGLLNSGGRLKELQALGQDRSNIFQNDQINNRLNILNTRLNSVSPQFQAGVNARNTSAGLADQLGGQLSGLTLQRASQLASNARAGGSAQASALRQIGNLQASGLLNAAESNLNGLLTTINGNQNLEQLRRGIGSDQLQARSYQNAQNSQNAQAIGSLLGQIGQEVFLGGGSSDGGNA